MPGTAGLFRTIVGVLALLLGQTWSPAAHATLDQCKGFSATGSVECVTMPQSLTSWNYGVPGPFQGVYNFATSEGAVDAYKGIIAANAGAPLCSGPVAVVSAARSEADTPSGWDFRRLFVSERFAATFAYGVRTGSGKPLDPYVCNPREISTVVFRYRIASCDLAAGWQWGTDDPRSFYCYKAATFEDRTCPTANPVLPGSGVKLLASTDYTSAGAHPLQFSRTYRSRWARAELSASMGGIANSAGRTGWLHNYERQIADVPFAAVALRRAARPDGSVNTFTATPDAQGLVQWKPEPGVRDALTPTSSGWDYKVFADDSVERYDTTGRLLGITERNGWTTTLTYSDATTPVDVAPKPGLLIRVANHFGRALTFSYEPNGRLAALLDPAGGAVRYGYDGFGNLSTVTWQDNTTRSYRHEDSRFPGHVTGITDEAGVSWSTYAYDANGRVASSELAGGAERLTFSYSLLGAQGTVYDASGTARYCSFVNSAGVLRPTSVSAPCPSCGSTARATSYDANFDKTKETAHDGTVSFFAYDAKGRETERATFASSYAGSTTRPALNLATKVTSTTWHATFNLPLEVSEPNRITSNTYNAKGMLTGQSWTATTDATGAAKFAAVKTGSTYATGWSYSASSLATSIVQKVDAVEARRWAFVYAALGDATKVTSTEAGVSTVATLTSSTTHGLLTQLSASNGAIAKFTYNTRNQLATAQLPDYGATMSYDARSLLTEVRFSASSWLRIVYDAAGNPLRLEDSAGQSQLIVGLAEPSGVGPRSRAVAAAAGARMRALMSSLRDPAKAAKWLPMASANAQVPPPPVVPASVLQGMSLLQTQQAASALDVANLAGAQQCCSAGGAGSGAASSQTVRDYLSRVTIPIQLMSYAASAVGETIGDEVLTLKSAYKLRKTLCAAGVTVLAGCYHAHHVVAVADRRAATSRAILANVGIDINDAANGLYVPCFQHGRLHTNAYYARVFVDLSSVPQTRPGIEGALAAIRAAIAAGAYP